MSYLRVGVMAPVKVTLGVSLDFRVSVDVSFVVALGWFRHSVRFRVRIRVRVAVRITVRVTVTVTVVVRCFGVTEI